MSTRKTTVHPPVDLVKEKRGVCETLVRRRLHDMGITVNGSHAGDIQVHDRRFYWRALTGGSLGLGESFMDNWWDCDALDVLIEKLLRGGIRNRVHSRRVFLQPLTTRLFNRQNPHRATQIARVHYDIGNDLFEAMLDKRMMYSCGYWQSAKTLDEAQENKLDLICRKLQLAPGMRILDIGCGWGGFLEFAAQRYGIEGVGLTISKNQLDQAQQRTKDLPLEFRLQDYRQAHGQFDAVLSIGFFEHVGHKNYRHYFEVCRRCLKPDGLSLLHTIGGNNSTTRIDPWFDKYIFPNAVLPSVAQIGRASEGLFVMEDLHNIGSHYDPTVMAWWHRFNQAWPQLQSRYGERFYRMWKFYLHCCAGEFRARDLQVWQILLSRQGHTPVQRLGCT